MRWIKHWNRLPERLWDVCPLLPNTQNLSGQDPEKPALQHSCSEQETGLETSKAPFQSTQYHHSGVMNDSWANQKNTPQTSSATTSINVLHGKNGSHRLFYNGSDSSHLRSVLRCWGKVIQRGHTPLWGGYCTGNLHGSPLSKSYTGNSYEWIFLLGWWSLFLLWPPNATDSQNNLGESSWYIHFTRARAAHTWFMIQ